jgi:DNA polymerase III epsilon subunit-like protein
MLLRECNITVLDFETTGPVADYPDEPWQIGLVVVEKGKINPAKSMDRFLYVGDRPISPYVPGRHARIRHVLKKSPRLVELWNEIRVFIDNQVLAAHSTGTEKKMLGNVFPIHSEGAWIDTLNLSRQVWPGLVKYNLDSLINSLGLQYRLSNLCPGRKPHDAFYDAMGSALILETILEEPEWCNITVSQAVKLSKKTPKLWQHN